MDISLLVNTTSRAWAIPILAHLHSGTPGRQAPLLAATGANRTAFAQSVDHLISIGLVERNPGHGHPLRPEFRLPPLRKPAGRMASRIHDDTGKEDQDLLRRAWTVPVLTTLHKPSHFNEIARNLRPITDRALSQSLKTLEARSWVQRTVDEAARPPRSLYRAMNTGGVISTVAAREIGFLA